MQADKSAIILEAQWLEKEIPRIERELVELREQEQQLLTTPMETVSRAYTNAYRTERRRAHLFYHRRRAVTPTRYGYRERMRDVGWLASLMRVLIVATVAWAAYIVYHNHQLEQLQRGVIWGSVLLIVAIGLALVPTTVDQLWERRARRAAQQAADQARQSEAFLQEKAERQAELRRCRERIDKDTEQLQLAWQRLDELRQELISRDHGEPDTA